MADGVNKFLGDTPGRTIIKLIVVCLVVGFVLTFWGFTPNNIIGEIRYWFHDLWMNGFQALGKIGNYLVLGAIIVIPIFVILRLMSYRR
ncbi:Hypothetical protein NGAL_HAMBI1145_11740 [Neorhizobium galegae bv. officinalis]|uniref:DUF6460 domain-containing protein n=1 Tax=Neorhizobium galegae bv. officinalis TaxID=323656 RepID=A0A0T7FBT7_NEOGA|nr:DUF6460 domain-containing protein [Neorhizobium galegae]CDZ32403.1 Hypothetical protein NGAL_HAMBI1145_11740 [Neorhizobium galegae bv. officinalis]